MTTDEFMRKLFRGEISGAEIEDFVERRKKERTNNFAETLNTAMRSARAKAVEEY